MIKGILFDLDGTLINSEKAFGICFLDTLNNTFGTNFTYLDYKKYELEQNSMLIKYAKENGMIPTFITDKDIMKTIHKKYNDYFIKIVKDYETKLNFKLIRKLKDKYILGLVTTCKRSYLDILNDEEDIYSLFDVVIAREDVEKLKPNEEAYIKALNIINLNNDEVIAIEDSKRGIDPAISANIKVIKVSNFTQIKFDDNRAIEVDDVKSAIEKIKKLH